MEKEYRKLAELLECDQGTGSIHPLFREIRNYRIVMIRNWISNEYREEFLKKLQSDGVLERIEPGKNVSENEKIDLLSKGKFFIRFGLGEFGTSYGTIEAMERGTPLIVNDEPGISDYLRNYSNCLIASDVSKVEEIKNFIGSDDNPVSCVSLQGEIKRMIEYHSWQSHCKLCLESVSEFGVESTNESFRGENDGR